MKYSDGTLVKLGDVVAIDGKYKGVVEAVIEDGQFSDRNPKEQWGYLRKGALVDTDFGGLVHYPDFTVETVTLKRRSA